MNELTTIKASNDIPMMDVGIFEQMQRVGRMLALSPMFPEHLRKGSQEQAIANAVLVVNMAMRLAEDPLTVSQNIYFVGGRPGWSTSYMISKANQHGVFKNPIDWDVSGRGDSLSVTAFAEMTGTGKRVAMTCDMAMAKAESWTRNAKYKSMPETMLRYRSAAALIRMYCPQVMVGIPAQVEVEFAMKDVTPSEFSEPVIETPSGDTISSTPAQKEKPAPEKAEPEKVEEERKPEPEQEAPHDPDTGEIKEEVKPEVKGEPKANVPDQEQFKNLYNTITNDLIDAADPSDVVDMYVNEIASMAEHAPDLHTRLQEEIKAALE